MTSKPFTFKGYKIKECLELVYTNIYKPFNVHAWRGYGYFITFSDDYSKLGYVHSKFDTLNRFFEFKVKLDLLGQHMKAL